MLFHRLKHSNVTFSFSEDLKLRVILNKINYMKTDFFLTGKCTIYKKDEFNERMEIKTEKRYQKQKDKPVLNFILKERD